MIISIDFSPDGNYFNSGVSDNTIKIWDIESAKQIKKVGD